MSLRASAKRDPATLERRIEERCMNMEEKIDKKFEESVIQMSGEIKQIKDKKEILEMDI